MGFSPSEDRTIEVICSQDDAIRDPDSYKEYLKTLDEDLLDLDPEVTPTRFILRTVIPYKASKGLKNDQLSYGEDGEVGVKLGFTMEEVRIALIDVRDPGAPFIAFKKDSDGFASVKLMEVLDASGILNDLYSARQNAMNSRGINKKKSELSSNSPSPTVAD